MAYRALRTTALVVITTITISISPSASAAGRSLTAGVNTILNGKGAPKSVLGIDGDFYIDTRSLLIYGPKTKGKWPAPQNIQGPTGPSGNDGRNGSDGKAITNSNVSNAVGPQGEKGEKGEKGDPGLPGVAGLPGAMGPAGPAGLPGATGAQGPSGSNGSNGATGATGATGAQGAPGVSKVTYGTLNYTDLSGSLGTGEYVQLNIFEARKSYLVRIKVFTYQPSDLTEYFLPLSLTVTSSATGAVVQTGYLVAHGYSYRAGSSRYENSIDGEIVLDGGLVDVDYSITILVTAGRSTSGTELVKLAGTYVVQEVANTLFHA